jgi:hypothetical protein
MAVHKRAVLENQTLILDGNEYYNCELRKCTLVFKGHDAVKLEQCHLVGCRWQFEDAALQTVALLKGLYLSGSHGKEVVEKIFRNAP